MKVFLVLFIAMNAQLAHAEKFKHCKTEATYPELSPHTESLEGETLCVTTNRKELGSDAVLEFPITSDGYFIQPSTEWAKHVCRTFGLKMVDYTQTKAKFKSITDELSAPKGETYEGSYVFLAFWKPYPQYQVGIMDAKYNKAYFDSASDDESLPILVGVKCSTMEGN